MQTSIHSTRVVLDGSLQDATVLFSDGVITGIEKGPVRFTQTEFVEAGDCIVMPGIIDPHVHINEPGRTEWEGFETATRAALSGGITTLVDMPLNSSPVTTSVKAFEEKLNATRGQLHCHCGFWGGLVPGNSPEIVPLIHKGVLGFKAFLTHSGIDEFPNVAEADLEKAMPLIAEHGLPLLVHCELSIPHAAATMANKQSYRDYLRSRPREWEDEAIAMMIRLCERYRCRTHIVHLSSSDSIPQLAAAKAKGLPLTVETAQHYLYFCAEDIGDGQTQFKCAPPIREAENNQRLWQALQDGIIDFVATDHSPSAPALKSLQDGDFSMAWGGIASIQFALPALWTVAKDRNAGPADIARWLCEAPASLVGLSGSKGKLAPGYDADILVWNPEQSFTVTPDLVKHRHGLTPYLGQQLYGTVIQTWLNGIPAFDNHHVRHANRGHLILH